MKFHHEFRDPIHAFVRMDVYERRVVDSEPFQRLRDINQLALTHLVYPGATHKRFEHSLGVMELAGRVFDTVVQTEKLREAADLVPELTNERNVVYWRNVVRMAALCHDLGHLPFSHAAEGLLPAGHNHETLTASLIRSEWIESILTTVDSPLQAEHVAEIATKTPGLPPWKQLLAEIIQSNFFGVDRIDYLLRDSHHAGVAYGRFDHFRLLDTIRILPPPPASDREEDLAPSALRETTAPALGVEKGGLQSAEALLLARYFMFSQVYLHPVRRIYDIHLGDFLRGWLDGGKFPIAPEALLGLDDSVVLVAIREAARDEDHPAHDPAMRIASRKHFKLLYQPSRADYRENLVAGHAIYEAACEAFGEDAVRHSYYPAKDGAVDFPVLVGEKSEAASSMLEAVTTVPQTKFDAVFVDPSQFEAAEHWLDEKKTSELQARKAGENDEEAEKSDVS